jgi:hypothetical protein
LWIDSLCIIQDSVADWEQECVNRVQIYQNSTVTVAGPAAANSDAGFLDRPSRAKYPAYTFSYELPDRKGMYCAQKAGVYRIDCGSTAHYLFHLGSELILVDIRKPYWSGTCLVRYSWSVRAEVYGPANRNQNAAYSQHSQGLPKYTEFRPSGRRPFLPRTLLKAGCLATAAPLIRLSRQRGTQIEAK